MLTYPNNIKPSWKLFFYLCGKARLIIWVIPVYTYISKYTVYTIKILVTHYKIIFCKFTADIDIYHTLGRLYPVGKVIRQGPTGFDHSGSHQGLLENCV